MANTTPPREFKDCEKGGCSGSEDVLKNGGSRVSRKLEERSLWARNCWHLNIAVTVLIFLVTALSKTVSSVESRPLRLQKALNDGRGVSSSKIRAPRMLDPTAIESIASEGCSSPHNVSTGTTKVVTLENRTYRLYFPVNYQPDEPAPLILSYHGGSRTAKSQEELDLLTTTYFNEDYIVVYPQGINETWQGVPGVQTDDVGFTAAILDELESKYCIDTNRIYATGKSQGGGFVGVLACDATLSTRVAAYAPVSGAFYVSDYGDTCDSTEVAIDPCNPGRTDIPMLEFHGLNDSTIAYTGGARKGGCLPSIPHWTQTWAERNGLGTANVSLGVPGALSGSSAVLYRFGQDSQKGLVSHIMDGKTIGHDWPSTNPNSDNSAHNGPTSFNASSIIIGYFATHPLGSGA